MISMFFKTIFYIHKVILSIINFQDYQSLIVNVMNAKFYKEII